MVVIASFKQTLTISDNKLGDKSTGWVSANLFMLQIANFLIVEVWL